MIQYLILQTNIIINVRQTIRRISRCQELKGQVTLLVCPLIFLFQSKFCSLRSFATREYLLYARSSFLFLMYPYVWSVLNASEVII